MMDALFRRLFSAESRATRLAGRFDADATRIRTLEEGIRRVRRQPVFGSIYGDGGGGGDLHPTLSILSPCGGYPLAGVTVQFAFDYLLSGGGVNPSPTIIATLTTGPDGFVYYPYDPGWVTYYRDEDTGDVEVIPYNLYYSAYHPDYGTWYPTYSGFGSINGPYNAVGTLGVPTGMVCVDPCFKPYPWATVVLETPWATFDPPVAPGTPPPPGAWPSPGVYDVIINTPAYVISGSPGSYVVAYPGSTSTVPANANCNVEFTITFSPGDRRGATCVMRMAAGGEGVVGGPTGYATLPLAKLAGVTDSIGNFGGDVTVIRGGGSTSRPASVWATTRVDLTTYSCNPLSLSFDFADKPEISVLSLGSANNGTFKFVRNSVLYSTAFPVNALASDIETFLNSIAVSGTSYTCTGGTGGNPYIITYFGTPGTPPSPFVPGGYANSLLNVDFSGLFYPGSWDASYTVTQVASYVEALFPSGDTIVTLRY